MKRCNTNGSRKAHSELIKSITAATALRRKVSAVIFEPVEARTMMSTTFSNTSALTIRDLGTVTSPITVNGVSGTVADIDVRVNLTHYYDADLDLVLITPAGRRIELSTDNGGGGDNYVNTIFDDEAARAIVSGSAPFSARFRPEGRLSLADGATPNGIYRLEVTDDTRLDGGRLNSWSLTIDTNAPVEQTAATPTFSHGSGSYTGPVNVTINSPTSGAAIRYTTDGSTPTENSALYNHPVLVSSTGTLRARAFRAGWIPSTIASASLVIGSTPTGDNDDQLSEARPFNSGGSLNGVIEAGTDVDMVRIDIPANTTFTLDIDRPSGSSLDSYLRVFDARGNEFDRNDDGPTPGELSSYESYLEVAGGATGRSAYIGIGGYGNQSYNAGTGTGDSSGSTGAYTLTVGTRDLIYDGTIPAQGTTDSRAWLTTSPPMTNSTSSRSRSTYDNVINQFAVANNPRYAQRDIDGNGTLDTFCNIFVWDVTRAMNAEIPHWANMTTGQRTAAGGGTELNANRTVEWMQRFGASYGWRQVTAEQAQANANAGRPSVVLWANPAGIGHEQVIRPGSFNRGRGAEIAQAGATNTNGGYVRDILPAGSGESYWAHD